MVELRDGPGDERGDQEDAAAADGLNGPGGVEEGLVIPARILDDAVFQADMGEEREPDDERCNQGHEAEEIGREVVGKNDAVDHAQRHAGPIEEHNEVSAFEGPGFEGPFVEHLLLVGAGRFDFSVNGHDVLIVTVVRRRPNVPI